MVGQTLSGHRVFNAEAGKHGEVPITLASYLTRGHFYEATAENWESEFLQMAFYVVLTIFLYQRGSSESKKVGEKAAAHGEEMQSTLVYMASSQFWFESFQNWQSEFLSLVAMVVLSVYLRQRGSPESKPVDAPHSHTGTD